MEGKTPKKVCKRVDTNPIYEEILKQAEPFLHTRKNLLHTRMSLRYTFRLLKEETGDEEVVIPAVLLQDGGWSAIFEHLHLTAFGTNLSNPQWARVHERKGAKIARTILETIHYPSNKIEQICRIIRGHDSRKRPISSSDRIVKDADKLWRYSSKGVAVDTDRFKISRHEWLDDLEKQIDCWFFTATAKKIARQEMIRRNYALP